MTTKQRKKKVKEANKAADKAIRDAQMPEALKSLKDFVYTPLTVSYGQFILACLLIIGILALSSKSEASCTYRTDSLGNVRYSCDAGISGTYRTDVLGPPETRVQAQRTALMFWATLGHQMAQRGVQTLWALFADQTALLGAKTRSVLGDLTTETPAALTH